MVSQLPQLKEIKFVATRSRGPGGQNVNKVSSAAQLTWHVESSESFTEEQKIRILEKLDSYINQKGELYLRSDEFRDLERNKSRCLEKLQFLIAKALHKPKARKKTKPTKSSQIKRVESKKQRGEIKKARQKVKL
ncbi:MAG: aminoacyl-tRNA hydrolase [Bdellovibrionaceae bacterium]|nr:aminoacyl-tRNA hydrolase [Pseudobdellovibrionaceae bacterium]